MLFFMPTHSSLPISGAGIIVFLLPTFYGKAYTIEKRDLYNNKPRESYSLQSIYLPNQPSELYSTINIWFDSNLAL